jgi:mono/diheme cytochrome c family protein
MRYLALFGGIVALLIACSPKTTESITEADGNMPKAAIGEGKVVYMKKCSRCHALKTVENFSREQWDNILPNMIRKAELSEEEAYQVTEYVHWEIDND